MIVRLRSDLFDNNPCHLCITPPFEIFRLEISLVIVRKDFSSLLNYCKIEIEILELNKKRHNCCYEANQPYINILLQITEIYIKYFHAKKVKKEIHRDTSGASNIMKSSSDIIKVFPSLFDVRTSLSGKECGSTPDRILLLLTLVPFLI